MQSFYDEFENRNVGLAAISTDLLVDAERMEVMAGAEFPILADTSEDVSKSYGVFNLLGDGVAAPATFVIRPDGGVVWGYVGINIGDRVPTQAILEMLDVVLGVEVGRRTLNHLSVPTH